MSLGFLRLNRPTWACVALIFTGLPAAADEFLIIPTEGEASALGVSADGLTVVGETEGQAFRWNQSSGVELLGPGPDGIASTAAAASADGSVVVGS